MKSVCSIHEQAYEVRCPYCVHEPAAPASINGRPVIGYTRDVRGPAFDVPIIDLGPFGKLLTYEPVIISPIDLTTPAPECDGQCAPGECVCGIGEG